MNEADLRLSTSDCEFSKILLSAVDDGLLSLGSSSKEAILYQLESSYQISRDTIQANLIVFSKALEEILGVGASFVEKLIIKSLHEKLESDVESDNMNLKQYVKNIRRQLAPKGDQSG